MKCLNCDNEAVGKGKYCSDACKVAYNRNRNRNKSVTDVTVNRTVTDACSSERPVDFTGRRKDYELLESWANGNGSESQQRLGALARQYRVVDVQEYLGYV